MKKILGKLNYLNLCCFVMALISLANLLSEKNRVFPHLQTYFIFLQISLLLIFLFLGLVFIKNPKNTLALHIVSVSLLLHCVLNSWYLPLFEIAYFQIVIGLSFVEYQKKYTFYFYAGSGLIGMLISHYFQAYYNYKLPEIQRLDLILVLMYCFILALLIHNFVTQKNKNETHNLKRYFTIGLNSARLIHDVKGLLSTPMLQVENAIDNLKHKRPNEIQAELHAVAYQLNKTQLQIYQLNLLCKNESEKINFNVNSLIHENLELINFKFTNIHQPSDHSIHFWGYKEKLNSAVFNILLNIYEAFEVQQIKNKNLNIQWSLKKQLVFTSNTILNNSKKTALSTGLGFQIMIDDLKSMNIRFDIKALADKTEVILDFSS